ncbi:MAG TPA: class D sortase [Xanthomonadaceae bacterium]|nr:class D sortase [Xanthomonadaceae bacterium]
MSMPFVSRALETACWVGAVVLLGVFFGGRAFGEFERHQAVASFTTMRAAAQVDVPNPAAVDDDPRSNRPGIEPFLPHAAGDGAAPATPDQREWSPERVRDYAASVADPAHAGSAPVALLRIERVGLEVPVYAEIDERNLNRGAALVAGTAAPEDGSGNVAIAAHRDGYFRALRNVAIGDVLELESTSRRRAYRITDISVVEPTDVSVLQETAEPAVTLVTCYPFFFVGNAPQRFIVRALAEQ